MRIQKRHFLTFIAGPGLRRPGVLLDREGAKNLSLEKQIAHQEFIRTS